MQNFKTTPRITADVLTDRIRSMAYEIYGDYRDFEPTFVVLMDGGMFFASTLLGSLSTYSHLPKEQRPPHTYCYDLCSIKSKTYHGDEPGPVQMQVGRDLHPRIANRDVVLIDDTIESGRTLMRAATAVEDFGPRSVRVAALLIKPESLRFPVAAQYVGFEIERFRAVGFGMDHDGKWRHLPYIAEATSVADGAPVATRKWHKGISRELGPPRAGERPFLMPAVMPPSPPNP